MKQFQLTIRNGGTFGPYGRESIVRIATHVPWATLNTLGVGGTYTDDQGGTWTRLPDLVLQDDVPLTAEDVTACRESAVRVRYKLRLERIATAAFSAIIGKRPFFSGTEAECLLLLESDARGAVLAAKALIAELDKQS